MSATFQKLLTTKVSRRQLLNYFSIEKIRNFFLPTKSENNEGDDEATLTLQQTILTKKQMLLKGLDNTQVQSFAIHSSDLFSLKINENCNGCPVCEKVCPTNALSWETNENESGLQFEFNLCISCEKCLACPTNALEKTEVKNDTLFSKKQLVSMKVNTCLTCGDLFKSSKEEEHCFFCKEQSKKDPMRFFQFSNN